MLTLARFNRTWTSWKTKRFIIRRHMRIQWIEQNSSYNSEIWWWMYCCTQLTTRRKYLDSKKKVYHCWVRKNEGRKRQSIALDSWINSNNFNIIKSLCSTLSWLKFGIFASWRIFRKWNTTATSHYDDMCWSRWWSGFSLMFKKQLTQERFIGKIN